MVTPLSSELLFTLENVERHAQNLKEHQGLYKDRSELLNEMLLETQRMNELLGKLMRKIRPK